ncbi:alpha-N-arabinofuranosidase [Pseudobutyrivibrio xylanivorans]|nr:alpha-N-arabinofuranosidase [Pseudobutyrivibrio xylanivorans]
MENRLIIDKDFKIGEVDKRLFGSFVEHMGRVVYSGIYEPDHPTADENGFRQDVAELAKKMGVGSVRYPGGNFVSNYNWMDGIGPKEKRPRKRDLAWKSIETNEVGIDEFMKWANKYQMEPIMAVNMGTKGLDEAVALIEYCNSETGTYYSDLRAENGHKEPYTIKTWCLGNEMDGEWQLGHKTAQEYGRLAHEIGKAMKLVDPSIELVVCGSSMSRNATFGDWEREVLANTYDEADYISLHQYYDGQDEGTKAFLARSLDMERYIDLVCGIADLEKKKRGSSKTLNICFDEWGVWSTPDFEVQKWVDEHPWQIAPPLGEQIYSMEDSLLFASMLMVLLKKCNRVKIGCQSLLANISACIMTKKGGEAWVQPIYFPFEMIANNAKGVVLEARYVGETYETEEFEQVPVVDSLVVYNEADRALAVFLVNRGEQETELVVDARAMALARVIESRVLYSDDIKLNNVKNHEAVKPASVDNVKLQGEEIKVSLKPFSFQMVRIGLK